MTNHQPLELIVHHFAFLARQKFCSFVHDHRTNILQRRSTVIAGKAAISVLLHTSKGKYKLGDVICHWLDGSIKTDISLTGLGNSAKSHGRSPSAHQSGF